MLRYFGERSTREIAATLECSEGTARNILFRGLAKLRTMGGPVTIENVVGDVKGSSMGGDVRYKNVRRKDGNVASPARSSDSTLSDLTPDTVQISTMGGDIEIKNARRFVRAKTMGGTSPSTPSMDGSGPRPWAGTSTSP